MVVLVVKTAVLHLVLIAVLLSVLQLVILLVQLPVTALVNKIKGGKMRIKKIDCPTDLFNDLQRLTYELIAEGAVIDRYIDRHVNEPSLLEAPIFVKYSKSVAEKTAKYEILKDIVTNEILEPLTGHEFEWYMDFTNGKIVVTVKCDCEIPWLDE